jgi:hypothetical protein
MKVLYFGTCEILGVVHLVEAMWTWYILSSGIVRLLCGPVVLSSTIVVIRTEESARRSARFHRLVVLVN